MKRQGKRGQVSAGEKAAQSAHLQYSLLVSLHDGWHVPIARRHINVEHPRHRQRRVGCRRLHTMRHDQVHLAAPQRDGQCATRQGRGVDVPFQREAPGALVSQQIAPAVLHRPC